MLSPRQQLKQLLSKPGIILAGGAGDAGGAKLVEEAGFPAVYMSGSFVAFTYGLPDVGYLTLTEMAQRVDNITRRVNVPLIADADDGYGDAVAVTRTIQEYEKAGASALHLEDEFPKKFGILAPVESVVAHIRAAVAARTDPDMLIIARTDAMRPWRKDLKGSPEDDTLRRSLAYVEAGADIVMIMSQGSEKNLRRFCREIPKPILVCSGTWDFDPSAAELEDMGVKIAIFPVFIRQKITPFLRRELRELLKAGKVNFTQEEREGKDTLNNILGIREFKKIQSDFKA